MIKGFGDKIAQSSLCNLITCPDSAETQKIRAKVEQKHKNFLHLLNVFLSHRITQNFNLVCDVIFRPLTFQCRNAIYNDSKQSFLVLSATQ